MGLGHLEIVTEHLVEPDLQAADARGLFFPGLQARQVFPPVAGHGAQLVQFRAVALPEDTAVPERSRRGRHQGPVQVILQLVKGMDLCADLIPEVRIKFGKQASDPGNFFEGL